MNDAVQKMMQDIKAIKADGEFAEPEKPKDEPQDEQRLADEPQRGEDRQARENGEDGKDERPGGDEPQEDEALSEDDRMQIERAKASGWKPESEWKGASKDFVGPREWNRHVKVLRTLDQERQRGARLQEEVDSFGDRLKNVMEVTKAKTVAELEAQRKEAVEEADYSEVKRLDDEIKQTEKDLEYVEPEAKPQPIRAEVEDWMADNPWFNQDREMTDFALDFQRAQLQRLDNPANPSNDELDRALKNTTRAMRNEFPDKLKRQPRAVAHDLERRNVKPVKRKFTYNDLSPQEKKVLEHIEHLPGGISREDYIQACADMRDAK